MSPFRQSGARAIAQGIILALVSQTLWLAWHAALPHVRRVPRPFAPRVLYVPHLEGSASLPLAPMLIALPTAAGAAAMEDKPEIVSLAYRPPQEVMLMEYCASVAVSRAVSLAAVADGAPSADEPLVAGSMERESSFAAKAQSNAGMFLEVAGDLAENGFDPAKFLMDGALLATERCAIVAGVEADESGIVRHVFLESPSDNAALNLLVIRALRQGTVRSPGKAVQGQVSVGFAGAAHVDLR